MGMTQRTSCVEASANDGASGNHFRTHAHDRARRVGPSGGPAAGRARGGSIQPDIRATTVRAADAGSDGRAQRARQARRVDGCQRRAGRQTVALIVDPALSLNNPNNDSHTAGVTFVGQFLDHDMTFDTTSRLGHAGDPRTHAQCQAPPISTWIRCTATAPTGSPQLYEPFGRRQVHVSIRRGVRGPAPAIRRAHAFIADPRNDENAILAGLQVAFLQVSQPRRGRRSCRNNPSWAGFIRLFDEARQQTTWHYQW